WRVPRPRVLTGEVGLDDGSRQAGVGRHPGFDGVAEVDDAEAHAPQNASTPTFHMVGNANSARPSGSKVKAGASPRRVREPYFQPSPIADSTKQTTAPR